MDKIVMKYLIFWSCPSTNRCECDGYKPVDKINYSVSLFFFIHIENVIGKQILQSDLF